MATASNLKRVLVAMASTYCAQFEKEGRREKQAEGRSAGHPGRTHGARDKAQSKGTAAMASPFLREVVSSDGLTPISNGLQPNGDGLQPKST